MADIAATMNLQWFSTSHYQNVQRTCLLPAISEYYLNKQGYVLDLFRNRDDAEPDEMVEVTRLGDASAGEVEITDIGNIHDFPKNTLFRQCGHEPLSEKGHFRHQMAEGTPPHQALTEVVEDKNLLKDLAQMTRFKHTGELEVFHSMLLKYAPKWQHFPYLSMKARLQLAVLGHNNVFREQSRTKTGDPRWSAVFSKRQNSWIARKKFSQKEYGFRADLLRIVISRAASGQFTYGQKVLPDPDVGGPNIAPVELGSKEELVLKFLSRFGDAWIGIHDIQIYEVCPSNLLN
ncbi:uncharacterized protein LOC117511442 [Thalassophryne amazonica]|uniref:uncharacterized protein LOC117511442 n=1 Tax=Thalassophryne amazonica TaxID=390379 RepID=UPI0014721332|nr:uncharacterized protein LOC117511442 [Thalassophryne amazonica]